MKPSVTRVLVLLIGLLAAMPAAAQCLNWSASTQLLSGSSCAGNGSFSVQLQGSDVQNLSNIQYGIPLTPSGFSVPLNNSPSFGNLPAGTFQVSVVADCGSATVGRNASITVPGSYKAPTWIPQYNVTRSSFNCMPSGWATVGVQDGLPPYNFTITSAPAAYTGPVSFVRQPYFLSLRELPPGNYTFQASDSCNSGTVPTTLTIAAVNPSSAPVLGAVPEVWKCDSILIRQPSIATSTFPWSYYYGDTFYTYSYQIPGILGPSPKSQFLFRPDTVALPAGTTIKDLYGKSIVYTVYPACGQSITTSTLIYGPSFISGSGNERCDSGFKAFLGGPGFVCYPVTWYIHDQQTNATLGPYVLQSRSAVLPPVPLSTGSYQFSYTTGDGFTGSYNYTVNGPLANSYSISVLNGSQGLNNFITGFRFLRTSGNTPGPAVLELVSGPPGYSYYMSFPVGIGQLIVSNNQSATPTTLKFPAGSYTWKITDVCGVSYLSVTVGSADMYQYTSGTPVVVETCQGVDVYPTGTATNLGRSVSTSFMIFRNGLPYILPGNTSNVAASGTPISLTEPGTYTFVTSASGIPLNLPGYYTPGGFTIGLPNAYNSSTNYVYNRFPIAVDLNTTQGFLCAGGSPGAAQIVVKGKDGFPFRAGGNHYTYQLAAGGNGLNGPYLATNTSGIFTNFGGNANGVYDVKVTDSCGAFAVQQLTILDLGVSRMISSSRYVACIGDSIMLSAAYLPGASYSWTGPAGFSATSRQPLIPAAALSNTGTYYVSITTTVCNQTIRDSVRIVVNPGPAKPVLSYTCLPRPIQLVITNPQAKVGYLWDIGLTTAAAPNSFNHGPLSLSDTLFIKRVTRTGSYAAIATDSIYGCRVRSDSIVFASAPLDTLVASIYAPRANICLGDSSLLVAKWTGSHPAPGIQWLRNGSVLSGATSLSMFARQAGQYQVIIDGGFCNLDTSAAITLNVIQPPRDTLLAARTIICSGDTAFLLADTGSNQSYIWERNGTVIPGFTGPGYPATQSGAYTVLISNSACLVRSRVVNVSVRPAPVVRLNPAGRSLHCPGESRLIAGSKDPEYAYAWYHNGTPVPGAVSDTFRATLPGTYVLRVATPWCGISQSDTATLEFLPGAMKLGNDTLICEEGRFPIRLSATPGFGWYSWSNGDSMDRTLATRSGVYWVAGGNRCGIFRDTIRVRDGDDFLPKFPDDTLVCTSTQRLVLRLPAGLTSIRWANGSHDRELYVDTPGRYAVTANGPCGPVADSIRVAFCLPQIDGVEGIPPICAGQCIWPRALVSGYPDRFEWQFPGGNPASSGSAEPGRVCYERAGDYPVTLIVTNKGGSDTASYTVTVQARPQLRFRDTIVLASYNVPIRISACADALVADWYSGDDLICANCPELPLQPRFHTGSYRCVVRNNDCPDSCSYSLRVVDVPNNVWLPDAFTPNGDGRNDRFGIITDNPNVQVGNLSVYNRWGERVFISNRNDEGWDGSFRGRPAEAGVYYWQLTYQILGRPETFHLKGDLTLIR